MAYVKAEVKTLADKVYDFLKGLRDGVDGSDMQNLIQAMLAAPAASNELRDDWDAAGSHMISQWGDRFGDDRINKEVPPE